MLGNSSINPSIFLFFFFSLSPYLLFSVHDLHSVLLNFPDMLSTSSDNEVDINLKLSINLSLYAIVLPSSRSFLTGIEKVIETLLLECPLELYNLKCIYYEQLNFPV